MPGLRWTEMSFIAIQFPSGRPTVIAGSSSVSNSPENARSKSASSPLGSSVARNPTSPKLTANTGTPVPAYSRNAVRIVPSPPITTHRSTSCASGASTSIPCRALRPCLRVSSASKRRRDPGASGGGDQRGERVRGVDRAAVREHRGDAGHGSTSRAAASRSASAPGATALGQVRERLAVARRAGQPRRGEAEHGRALIARGARDARRSPRAAAPGRAPRRPCRSARGRPRTAA